MADNNIDMMGILALGKVNSASRNAETAATTASSAADRAEAAAEAADGSAGAMIAEAFSTSKAYIAGDYVTYGGALYRFTSAHAAGAWNGSDAVECVVGNEVSEVNSAVGKDPKRVVSLTTTKLVRGNVIETVGIPAYVDNVSDYSTYGLTETGWYIFARVNAKGNTLVTANTAVTGDAGHIATVGAAYIDIAIRFDVAAQSQEVTIDWGNETETYIFKATDLAIRNLDYRTTFYVYDISPYTTWTYTAATDETFVTGKHYYTLSNGVYTEAIEGTDWTAGDAIPAETYYVHASVTFEGMARNITYKLDTPIDCPQVYVLPEIEEDVHGAWYEIRLQHTGLFSSTLQVPEGVKVATEHTQAETAGLNMIDLHYSKIGNTKLWRFLNTHSTIPA